MAVDLVGLRELIEKLRLGDKDARWRIAEAMGFGMLPGSVTDEKFLSLVEAAIDVADPARKDLPEQEKLCREELERAFEVARSVPAGFAGLRLQVTGFRVAAECGMVGVGG